MTREVEMNQLAPENVNSAHWLTAGNPRDHHRRTAEADFAAHF